MVEAVTLTPVEELHGGVWAKRDDLFTVAGVSGGKARSCYHLATRDPSTKGLVTAGSRASPQVNIVAHIAAHLGVPCRVHTPTGALSPEVLQARDMGAEVVQHKAGYNAVIVARAREDAQARGWLNIPFGMECVEAVEQTAAQVESLVPLVQRGAVRRVVLPVGSGMSLCGVLAGIERHGLWGHGLTVLGVVVGADPMKRLLTYGPRGSLFGGGEVMGDALVPAYLKDGRLTLTPSGSDYHDPAPDAHTCPEGWGFGLDPHYEAKCVPHLRHHAGDCLWVVGVRKSLHA